MLHNELKYFIDHQDDLVRQHRGKFIVIKDEKVIGVYDTEIEAYSNTKTKHELGTFLIQKCEPGEAAYTQTFHSRVSFA